MVCHFLFAGKQTLNCDLRAVQILIRGLGFYSGTCYSDAKLSSEASRLHREGKVEGFVEQNTNICLPVFVCVCHAFPTTHMWSGHGCAGLDINQL